MKTSKFETNVRRSGGETGYLRKWLATLLLSLGLLAGMTGSIVQAADAVNRQQAIDMALRQNNGKGKVLGVQTVKTANGQTVFAVKVLSNGRVRVFRIRQAR